MKESENIFDKLKELAGKVNGKFNILENEIDINIQMEYFKYSQKVKEELDEENIISKAENLFLEDTSLADKQHLLSQLASIGEVKAYRILEKYNKNPDLTLKNWSILAFQESKMLLEGSLLNENQVFISTGLGGKASNLRYFIVLFNKSDQEFNATQQKLITSEFEFAFSKNNSSIEEVTFVKNFSTLTVLIPLSIAIQDLLQTAIDECNTLGDFIKEDFIVTNVKKLSNEEIDHFIKNKFIEGFERPEDINDIELL